MSKPLSGRVAVITGASSGIGKGIALALVRSGAAVALVARRADRLEAVATEVKEAGGQALVVVGDVSDESFATSMIERAVQTFGRLDILINSAGIVAPGSVANANTDDWRRALDVNFLATLYACAAALPHMTDAGRGDIVNISSIAGRRAGGASMGPYSASKHALNVMSEGLRQEAGARGIRVCVVEPGATNTEVADSVRDPAVRASLRTHVSREGTLQIGEVGDLVAHLVALPPHFNVSEIMIRPTSDVLAM